MRVKRLQLFGERVLAESPKVFYAALPPITRPMTGPIQATLAGVLLAGPADSRRMLNKPLCVLAVLKKPSGDSTGALSGADMRSSYAWPYAPERARAAMPVMSLFSSRR